MNDVVVGFRTRSDARVALIQIAEAVSDGLLEVSAAAMLWTGRRGRPRVVHGLPLTRTQRAERTLVGLGPLVGVPVDIVPTALGAALPHRVPAHVLDRALTLLSPGQTAVAVRLAPSDDVPVLMLAELVRTRRPTAVLTSTLGQPDATLLAAALT